eukprot:CAMPEP_0184869622 /NCGR_PEP_ID=MMETSP0580-20130426/34761_1 /TAXON_ID=1118495 /ORGANISM="Dactyliosolen fragilissimus" /LENGTH=115 /DNA_ID=CAMNT_0027371225 /DNA_START=7 /DNA_END=351 /DNA_ORIENTATION=-
MTSSLEIRRAHRWGRSNRHNDSQSQSQSQNHSQNHNHNHHQQKITTPPEYEAEVVVFTQHEFGAKSDSIASDGLDDFQPLHGHGNHNTNHYHNRNHNQNANESASFLTNNNNNNN